MGHILRLWVSRDMTDNQRSIPCCRARWLRLHRRCVAWICLLLILLPLLFDPYRGPVVERLVDRITARRLLRHWNLSPRDGNLSLVKQILGEVNQPVSAEPWGDPLPPVTLDPARPFSPQWTYGDLAGSEGVIDVALHMQDKRLRAPLQQWIDEVNAADGLWRVRRVDSWEEFVSSFEEVDMVFYFGHANLGRGLWFGDTPEDAEWLHLAPPTLELPSNHLLAEDRVLAELPGGWVRVQGGHHPAWERIEPRCKVFWFMSCRSYTYYRAWFRHHFPAIDMVSTHYVLDPITPSVQIMEAVRVYMEAGQPITAIVEMFNRRPPFERLHGHLEEQRVYRATDRTMRPLYTAE